MRSELNYAGKNLSEFGMWFDNSKVYKKPSKRFMGYDIPARNGTLYQSENNFNNVIIEFDCFIKDNFDQNYNDLVNYLNSFETYQKLVNSYNGNMYRMALFHEAIEVDTGQFLKDGRFKLFFDCKPQEYYADGAEFERIASHSDIYTGNPAELENEGESSVISLRVALEPIQAGSGEPSPTNIRPITGHTSATVTRTRKNLFNGQFAYHNADKYSPVVSGNTYTVSSKSTGAHQINMQYITNTNTYYGDSKIVSEGDTFGKTTVTIPTDVKGVLIYVNGDASNSQHTAYDTQIELGSSATEYEPYQGQTYTIDLNGTRYDGTVDLATGVLTVTHVYGETTWGAMSDASTVGTMVRKRYSLGTTLSSRAGGLSNVAPYNGVAGDFDVDKGTRWFNDTANAFFYLPPSTPSTTSIQMVAQLATPQTVQLTAQQISLLTGTNYISSSGEVTVTTSTPLILNNPSPMTAKPVFKFTNITAPFTVSANGETIISFQNAIRLIKYAIANNMTFNANGTTLTVTKTGTPAYTETSILINSGYLPAGRYSFASATLGSLEVRSADGTQTFSSGGTFTLTDITQVKIWYVITPSASTPQTFSMPIRLQPLGDLYVNSEMMDCYMIDGDTAYAFNECVDLPKDFLQLDERTVVTMTSGAVGFIAPNWWRL